MVAARTDRPKHDARVVLRSADHGGQIAPPPLIKVHVVVVGVLPVLEAIERLVHDEHAQPVAGVEEGRRDGVVARADRIVAEVLQVLDAALLSAGDRGGAQRTIVTAAPDSHGVRRRSDRSEVRQWIQTTERWGHVTDGPH